MPQVARSRVGALVGVGVAALLLAPLLGRGYVLVRDMVFVPRTPLGSQLLGVNGVPRGVPSELFVALGSRVLPGDWLQDVVLLALVIGAAAGAAALAPVRRTVGAAAAATTYGWSAYLHERLLLGQWALLVGWAVLPWAARSALDWRRGGSGWPAVACLAVAGAAGANALLLVALVVVLCGRPLGALAATTVLALPWAVPGLLVDQVAGDPRGVAAFASRGDNPLGVVVSLLTGGGVWAREAVPPGRAVGIWVSLAVLVVGALGLASVQRRLGSRLLVAAGAGLLLALLGRLPGTSDALRWAVVHVPATGLLRDGQKWVAPLLLLTSAAVGCGAERLVRLVAEPSVRRVAGALLVLAPLAALPGAAWAEGGRLTASTYPADWERVTRLAHGPVLVLPWTLYRAFPWNDRTPVLDPATKLLARPVVNDTLPLGGGAVGGEDPVAARLDALVRSGAPLGDALRAAGVGQVLVERSTQGFDPALAQRQTAGLMPLTETPELALYAVPGPLATVRRPSTWAVVPGDLAALGLSGLAVVQVLRRRSTGAR